MANKLGTCDNHPAVSMSTRQFNPLSPKSDQHQISPYNINAV